MTLDGNIIYH